MIERLGPLLRKELLQVRRSRGAVLSGTLVPLLLMVIMPGLQLASLASVPEQAGVGLRGAFGSLPDDLAAPDRLLTEFLLPLVVAISGLLVPSVAATYTVVAEHERRTLDLLVALPVRASDVLAAKMLATLALAVGVALPMFAVDAAALLWLGLAGVPYVLQLLGVLLAALVCSVGESLVLALVARDLRTTNNLNGALLAPITMAEAAILLGAPAPARLIGVALLLLGLGGLGFAAAWRWLTFERYLAA
jgi:ABC-type Na+ efflux pump permease subunit